MSNQKTKILAALTFNYHQRAWLQELEAAKKVSEFLAIPHQVITLDWMEKISSSLIYGNHKPPEFSFKTSNPCQTAREVWVPNRNGVFINIAASLAEEMEAEIIVVGFNYEEAQTFPDNSLKFVKAINRSLTYSTLNKIKVVSFTQDMDKKEIVKLGKKIGAPLDLLWSCYYGKQAMCGQCESCQRCIRAFKEAGYWETICQKFSEESIDG